MNQCNTVTVSLIFLCIIRIRFVLFQPNTTRILFMIAHSYPINHQLELIWVPGHQNIEGKEKANKRKGLPLDKTMACFVVQNPLGAVTNKINDWALREIRTIWFAIDA